MLQHFESDLEKIKEYESKHEYKIPDEYKFQALAGSAPGHGIEFYLNERSPAYFYVMNKIRK